MPDEWRATKKWNPFNSGKLMAHVDTWSRIKGSDHRLPPPVLVTIDLTNRCNLNCSWCNARKVRENGAEISTEMLIEIAHFLNNWGVKAVCIAGGGEPILHDGLQTLIGELAIQGIRIGIVTNGTRLSQVPNLSLCDWVGVSIDTGTSTTYKLQKGDDRYADVLSQVERLANVKDEDFPLYKPGLGNGVFWKFLVHPSNVSEVYTAAQQAKFIGCKAIHFRPAGTPWDQLDGDGIKFTGKQRRRFNDELSGAMNAFDDKDFSVYGVRHKFDRDLKPVHNFKKCRAMLMTAVIMPSSESEDGFDLGFCCDRRGDSRTIFPHLIMPDSIGRMWGSETHWEMANAVCPQTDCPRCTYAPHNEIYERVILNDDMTHVFI